MNDDAWFEICSGALLMQGDVLQGCEILRPRPANVDGGSEIEADIETVDVIVITQSCDLEHPGKIDDVLLAQISSYDDLVAESKKQGKSDISSKGFRKKCVRG